MDDYVDATKVLWTTDVASYEGPFVSFRDVMLAPKPVQSPHPPIWVGGASNVAIRRTARVGDAWHPLGIRVEWLKDIGLPRLERLADREGRPVPALCPRILCHLTDSPLPNDERVAGEGTLDQVRGDLEALQTLGAEYVVLDTKRNSPTSASPTHHEEAFRTLTVLAEKAVDLEKETVR